MIDMRLGSSEWGSNEPCIGQWGCIVAVAGRVEQLMAQGQLEQADEQSKLRERRRSSRRFSGVEAPLLLTSFIFLVELFAIWHCAVAFIAGEDAGLLLLARSKAFGGDMKEAPNSP